MKVSLYVPTRELHESIKAQAGREGRTVSDYIVNLHKEHMGCLGNDKWKDKE